MAERGTTSSEIASNLSTLAFWPRLDATQQALMERNASIRTYPKGALIHGGSDACLGFTLLLEGDVRACLLSEEGREITLFHLYPGDPCMLTAACVISQITFDTHLVAEQACKLLVVNAGTVETLAAQNIYVRCFLYELATARFSSVMWSMQQVLFARFDRRLATFLLGEYARTGNPEIHMTHEQIAQHVSSAREVVARMLKRFAADGLVEMRRGAIRLTDPDGLRQLL